MRIYQYKHVVGNRTTVSLLQRSVHSRTLKNVIILSGHYGTGKSTCGEITGLSLTCENPSEGEPCLNCDECKKNIRALQTSGVSNNLVKKNCGLIDGKKDINELVKEIFVLQGSVGNNVYIIEEPHALSSKDQIPLLEELDRLPENTYVIFCTTQPHRLLPELRSRAITYSFSRLNNTDMKLLFDRTVSVMGIDKVSSGTEYLLTRYSKGVPRDMVNMIEFVKNDKPSEEELRSFLKYISNETFLDLFRSMRAGLGPMAKSVEELLRGNSLDTVINQLKEFVVNCIFLVEGASTGEFSNHESKEIKEIFTEEVCYKVASVVDRFDSYNFSEADFKLSMIRLRQVFVGRKTSDILSDNVGQASSQRIKAQETYEQDQSIKDYREGDKIARLSLNSLKSFGKEK